ncbi:MAG: glycerophosphodiester phosphodiesterase [Ruminococcus sp.]|nr:glycerophosphodiester phosphodiesterase [Ruminococcus sp.]
MIRKSQYTMPVYRGRNLGRKRRRQRKLFFFLLTVLIVLYISLLAYSNRRAIYRTYAEPLKAPKTFTAVEQPDGKIKLKWSSVNDAEGYKLYKYNNKAKKYQAIKKFNKATKSFVTDFDDTKYAVKAYKRVWNWTEYSEKSSKTELTTISDMIEVVGHRGAMDKAPENTLASYKKAYELGYQGFETDYWETYSGDLIISHEKSIFENTGIYESVKNISEDTRKYYPVTKGINVDKYETQYLVSFEQAIKTAADYKMNIYLHTKNNDLSYSAVEKIVSIIKKHNMLSKATVFTSNRDNFHKLKEYDLRVGFLVRPESKYDIENAISFAGENKADVFIMQYKSFLRKADIKTAHKYKLKVGCYDINNRESAFKMIDFGADFLITNKYFLS